MDDEDKSTALTRPLLRRVMVGTDADGRSTMVSDGPPPVAYRYPPGAMATEGALGDTRPPSGGESLLAEVWAARLDLAGSLRSTVDPTHPEPTCEVECEPGQVKWRMVRFGPGRETPMHATRTLDCNVVVAGELELLLESGRTRLRPGDAVVLPGLVHGWRAGPSGCTVSVTMIGLAPDARGER